MQIFWWINRHAVFLKSQSKIEVERRRANMRRNRSLIPNFLLYSPQSWEQDTLDNAKQKLHDPWEIGSLIDNFEEMDTGPRS